jgi:hypothetical protein
MTRNDPLVSAERAARRYWNVDGLAEIYTGCFFLLVPLLNFLWQHASIAPVWLALGGLVAMTCTLALSRTILIAIRRRLTYPRTGYVSFRRLRAGKEAAGMALILIAVLAIFVLMALTTDWLGGLTAISGLTIGVLDVYLGRIMGLPRFYFLSALSIAAGALLGLAEPTFVAWFPMEGAGEVFSYLFGIIGAGYLVTGGITLVKYLRENPAPAPEHA